MPVCFFISCCFAYLLGCVALVCLLFVFSEHTLTARFVIPTQLNLNCSIFLTVLTYDDLGGEEDESMPYGDAHHHNHQSSQAGDSNSTGDGSAGKSRRPSLPHVEMVRPAQTDEDQGAKKEEPKVAKRAEYKEEERRHIMQTEAFQKFIDRTVRITERALACTDSLDIFVDYTGQVECLDK